MGGIICQGIFHGLCYHYYFMASERIVSGASSGFRFGPSKRAARLDGGGDPLSLEMGARIELLEQLRVLAHLVTCTECVTSSRLGVSSCCNG